MCCRRRERRAPVVVTLGKLAYDKYQERKMQRLQENSERSPSPEILEHQANSEILEKAGISPPSYNFAVNEARVPDYHVNISEKALDQKDSSVDIANTESFRDVADGFQVPQANRIAAPAAVVQNRTGCCGGQKSSCQSKCEQRRAERLARKAEKQAAKMAARELRM